MSRIIITENALRGIKRCRQFLESKNLLAAKRASQVIFSTFELLEKYPAVGRPDLDRPELKELIIKFGASGYVALYRYIPNEDIVYIVAFRHQKEIFPWTHN